MTIFEEQCGRIRKLSLVVGTVGLLSGAVGGLFNPQQFFWSYLFAFVFWVGLPLGSLCVLMLHHLTGGGWGYTIRRFLEASIATLPWMALLFIPIAFGSRLLYPWANPEIVAHSEALQKIHAYLNSPAYLARMALFFGLWSGAAWYLNRLSVEQDETSDAGPTRRARVFSGPGLVFFVVTVSLAVVDWVMVLERDWYSTVFPLLVIIGQILVTFAFCTLMLSWVTGPAPFRRGGDTVSGAVRIEHFHLLGNFLLAFVMMWAYLTVSQLIIIWSGNVPREIAWYLHRVAGGWRYVAIFIGLFNFGLPFCLLLSRENKKDVRFLRVLAIGICAVQAVATWWLIAPSLHREGIVVPWMDAAMLIGIGGIWLAVFLTRLKVPLSLPQGDPRMEEALAHGH